jgi:long-chain acyl-CoA synthetase
MKHLAQLIETSCKAHAARPAMRVERNGQWLRWSYADLGNQIERLAQALYRRGLRAGDRAAICSPNRPEWSLTCLALYRLRVMPVPIYATSTAAQIIEIVRDSGSSMIFLGGELPLSRISELKELDAPQLISLESGPGNEELPHLADLLSAGDDPESEVQIQAQLALAAEDDTAVLIYTSGTTGVPKGVMLSHANFFHQYKVLENSFEFTHSDRSLCFLPLSHIFEHSWSLYVLAKGAENVYLEDPREVAAALKRVRPTVLCSVPRLYEKVMQTVYEKVGQAPPIRQKLFHWAMKTGHSVAQMKIRGETPSFLLGAQHKLADKLVLSKLREAMGGDKKFMSSGGAALLQEVEEFFHAIGFFLCQGYGLTETSPMVTCNRPREYCTGSVGRVISDVEVRIAESSGEVLVKGPNVFQGYWNKPEATEQVLKEGWFHTGDVGKLDSDGYLRITDRIKDLIITSQGKNVAPQRVESLLVRDSYIEQVAAVGDGRKCITALVVPVFEKLEAFAREHGLNFDGRESLLKLPEVMELIRQRIEAQSRELASYEMVKRFALLPEMFSEATGTLTPTLKLRRQAIQQRYHEMIEQMYHAIDEAVISADRLLRGGQEA